MDTTQIAEEQVQLTLKQRKWIKVYLETGNATEAAMQVYDCKDRDSAANIGWENVRKLDFGDLMEEGGITDGRLKRVLDEGLDSNKVVSAMVINKKSNPTSIEGELPLADSKTNDFVEVPDMPTRHKYLETALKLKKRLSNDNGESSDEKPVIHLNVSEILIKVYGSNGIGSTNEVPGNS